MPVCACCTSLGPPASRRQKSSSAAELFILEEPLRQGQQRFQIQSLSMIEEGRRPDVAQTAEDANRRYNDALTSLDRALAPAVESVSTAIDAAVAPPALPAGWRGHALRIVH